MASLLSPKPGEDLVGPPAPLLAVAAAAAIATAVLLIFTSRWTHVGGYICGTFVTIFAVALFRRMDAQRSTSPLYSSKPWMGRLAIAVLVAGVALGVVNIYYLAQRVG